MPTCPTPPPVTIQQIQAWRTYAQNCFTNYYRILTFPAPPGGCRTKPSCLSQKDRALLACDCAIKHAFKQSVTTKARMKQERTKWHPDKFSSCCPGDGEKKALMQKKAREVFVVVQSLCDEMR